MVQLMEDLIVRLSTEELELFLVQALFIWHQRNAMIHGKSVQAPPSRLKLNFDAAIFKEIDATGMGAIIRNENGEVMAALSAKGPLVTCSEKAEVLACRRARRVCYGVWLLGDGG